MNESTLVPREEMSDLDWLARNVHRWIGGDYMIRVGKIGYTFREHCEGETTLPNWYTCDQWLARRAELQNKPSFADHPDAKCLVQMSWGGWFKNKSDVTLERRGEKATLDSCGTFEFIRSGEVLGDWRDTLEKRPEQAEFDPFVSVEDAATAKQHDPVNSPSHYASGGIECIESIKASMSHEAFLGYLKGNVQKYMWRYEKKVNPAEDLKKAQWYLSKLIEEQK